MRVCEFRPTGTADSDINVCAPDGGILGKTLRNISEAIQRQEGWSFRGNRNAAAGSIDEACASMLRPANLPTHSVVLHDGSGNRLVADVEAASPSEALSKVLEKIRPEERQNWSEERSTR